MSVRVEGCEHALALHATSAAFAVMEEVHRAMSFHDPASELSRLNRLASRQPVRISAGVTRVIAESLAMAAASGGVFDPTVAPLAVEARRLPRPEGATAPDPDADWRDIDLDLEARTVRFRRPLWLDLGGVAKGYAVDAACATLRAAGVAQGCVNAGGDLSVFGPRSERVALRNQVGRPPERVAHLNNASLASSGDLGPTNRKAAAAAHFNGRQRCCSPRRFVSVRAPLCLHADALTKVVMVRGRGAHRLLLACGASAAVRSAAGRWSISGCVA